MDYYKSKEELEALVVRRRMLSAPLMSLKIALLVLSDEDSSEHFSIGIYLYIFLSDCVSDITGRSIHDIVVAMMTKINAYLGFKEALVAVQANQKSSLEVVPGDEYPRFAENFRILYLLLTFQPSFVPV